MVDGEKPPKDKGQASNPKGSNMDQYDPFFLYSNDTSGVPLINFKLKGTETYKVWKAAITIAIHTKNKLGFINGKLTRPIEEDVFMGQVSSKNAKVVWDELKETYSKQDAFVIFNMHFKIHSFSQSGSPLSEYYYNFNFLVRIDKVYALIRSITLTTDPIPYVKGPFGTLTLNRPNLVYTQCNMNGHTADRCFELVGYPPNFKKNTGFNKGSTSNNVVAGNRDQSTSNFFTDEQYMRLMALIGDKTGSSSMPANIAGINCVISFCSSRFFNHNSNIRTYKLYIVWIIDSGASQHLTYTILNMFNVVEVSKLNMTVSHPNGTKAVVTHVGSLRLTDKIIIHDVLVVSGYEVSLLSVHKLKPKTFDEASKDIRWVEAMNLEMEALNRNGTWVITELPVGRKPIGSKWVFKVKYKSTGEVERFKARLVAKGLNQKEGIDYEETFSPVVKIVFVRCILSIAVYHNWPLYQLDINNAFLYGDLVEDVYMSLPDGYFDNSDRRFCKLVKSLYDLKQALRKWNEKLTSVLLENDFKQSKNDFSLFIKDKNEVFIVLLVYVDAIVITGIEVLEPNGNLYLSQRTYYLELLADFGNKEGLVEIDKPLSVHVLSQYMHAPLQSHLKLAFRVLRYLKNAPGKGISFCKSDVMNLNLISWKSKKQSRLSESSTKAEYMAMNTIQIAANPVFHERTKHFEIELFFLREKVADGVIKTIKIKSADNTIDIFTKGLSVVDHNRYCENLGFYDMYKIGLKGNIKNIKPNHVGLNGAKKEKELSCKDQRCNKMVVLERKKASERKVFIDSMSSSEKVEFAEKDGDLGDVFWGWMKKTDLERRWVRWTSDVEFF
ncbi:putative RNA-directed DNA polymerase [Tanacetum coccineum]